MSLINNYLKKAALKQQKNEQAADVPPFLLQDETATDEDRSLTLMIAVLFVLLILLTGSGYLFFFRESREPSPFTQIRPPKPPSSFDSRKPTALTGTDHPKKQSGGQEAPVTPAGNTAGTAGKAAAPPSDVPRVYAVEGPVVDNLRQPASEEDEARPKEHDLAGLEGGAEEQSQSTPLINGGVAEAGEKPAGRESDIRELPLPLAVDEAAPVTDRAQRAGMQTAGQGKPRLFRESRNEASYLYQIGLQAQKNGDLGRAERYYRLALRQKPSHLDSLINLSAVYIREGRYDDARPLLRRILDLDENNAKAMVNLGLIAMYTGKQDQAREAFEQALQADPTEETALVNLAYIAQQHEDIALAEEYFQRLLKIAPKNRDALLAYANLEENSGKYDMALGLYSRCLELVSMQQERELYNRIKNRINLLRQYKIQESYRKFFSEQNQPD